jgi:hypothetical protein
VNAIIKDANQLVVASPVIGAVGGVHRRRRLGGMLNY